MAYGRGPGRPKKIPDATPKLMWVMGSREKVWQPCSEKESKGVLKKFDAAEKKKEKWFSLEPYATARVRVDAVEAVYYLGPTA